MVNLLQFLRWVNFDQFYLTYFYDAGSPLGASGDHFLLGPYSASESEPTPFPPQASGFDSQSALGPGSLFVRSPSSQFLAKSGQTSTSRYQFFCVITFIALVLLNLILLLGLVLYVFDVF